MISAAAASGSVASHQLGITTTLKSVKTGVVQKHADLDGWPPDFSSVLARHGRAAETGDGAGGLSGNSYNSIFGKVGGHRRRPKGTQLFTQTGAPDYRLG